MAIIIEIKAVPSSGRSKIVLDKSGIIKCYLKSQAESGKANKELIKLFSDILNINQKQIYIISGLTNPKKKIRLDVEIDQKKLYDALGFAMQTNLLSK